MHKEIDFVVALLIVAAGAFVAGASYGVRAERKVIAELIKGKSWVSAEAQTLDAIFKRVTERVKRYL